MTLLTTVAPPQATPPVHSLVRAAVTNLDDEPGWERGLTYLPETTGGYRALSGCTARNIDHTLGNPPVVQYQPWELQVVEPCQTTFAYNEETVTERLARSFAAVESYAIARELMTGELTKADAAAGGAVANLYLAKAPTVLNAGAAVSPNRAIGLLEEALGDALHGQPATLHFPRVARPYLWTGGTQQVGSLLYTSIGNLIVSDAGYANTAPDGTAGGVAAGTAWVYGTGPVVVRRSGMYLDAVAPSQTVDTATNTITRKGNKVVAATFDSRALFAVPVTLT